MLLGLIITALCFSGTLSVVAEFLMFSDVYLKKKRRDLIELRMKGIM